MTSHTDTSAHLSFDELCALADAPRGVAPSESAHAHLAQCDDCATQLAGLGALRARARQLPHEVAPPAELWAGVRSGIAAQERGASASRSSFTRWRFAAAALVIALGSSAVTMVAMRAREGGMMRSPSSRVAGEVVSSSASGHESRLPARLASAELEYGRSVESLRRTLDERRDSLSSSTVETVERSLRIADEAIAEARAALERDPSNGVLAQIFTSNYERKIDVLRRATELAPRT